MQYKKRKRKRATQKKCSLNVGAALVVASFPKKSRSRDPVPPNEIEWTTQNINALNETHLPPRMPLGHHDRITQCHGEEEVQKHVQSHVGTLPRILADVKQLVFQLRTQFQLVVVCSVFVDSVRVGFERPANRLHI